MKHRIFIAINLPENIKKRLSEYEAKWLELPCRWTKKENLHITLAFLGYLADEELLKVCKITKEVALKHEPFFINLNKIMYGPPNNTPRMIWVEGEKSQELGNLQRDLENTLSGLSTESKNIPRSPTATGMAAPRQEAGMAAEGLAKEGRGYTVHITLGRLKQWEFRQIEPEERPQINEEISLSFDVESLEIMESELKRGGPTYSILESVPLC